MNSADLLKKDILKKTAAFYKREHGPKQFIRGISRVPYAGRVFDAEELTALVDASLEFWLTAGRWTRRFEKEFAAFHGRKYCYLVNSGSSANLLAISALTSPLLGRSRLSPGDEVLTTACGFPTTLNPIIQNNLTPVFVDIDIGTYNANAKRLAKAVSKKTKAIVLAHTLGNPFDADAVLKIVKKYRLWLIEDNCDGLGSLYKNRPTGTFGHISTSSFYPAHHITMGEGGAVLTDHPLLSKILLSLRDWGRDCWCEPGRDNTCGRRFTQRFETLPFGYDHKYVYSHIGYNLKATDMQAAVGCAQLRKLRRFIKIRQKNFMILADRLRRYEKFLVLPQTLEAARPSWFGFPIFIKERAPFERKVIVDFLETRGIATRMLFGGNLLRQPAYKNIRRRVAGGLCNTDEVMSRLFWVGVYPGLTPEAIKYMTDAFDDFFKGLTLQKPR